MPVHRIARAAIAASVSAGIVCAGGCSAFQPRQQDVTINSFPHGASINVDGSDYGGAPVIVKLDRNKRHTVVASLGGEAVTRQLNPHVSTTGVLDIIGGVLFLIPAIGIATPGFWTVSDLNPTLILPSASGAAARDQRAYSSTPAASAVKVATPAAVKQAAPKPEPAPQPTASKNNDPNFKPAPRIKIYED